MLMNQFVSLLKKWTEWIDQRESQNLGLSSYRLSVNISEGNMIVY